MQAEAEGAVDCRERTGGKECGGSWRDGRLVKRRRRREDDE
jgi:hypothetical protein